MLDRTLKVKDIVLLRSETARVFQEHTIDFCCKGDVTVDEACARRGIDATGVWRDLEAAVTERSASGGDDPRSLSTGELVARIVDKHHAYLRKAMPYVQTLMAKVARVHGDHNQKLPALERAVEELAELLMPHIDVEERVLFPLAVAGVGPAADARARLDEMLDDHLAVASVLEKVHGLADGFEPPSWACNSYRALMRELAALEADTMRHVHLENHVLAPRLVAGGDAEAA